MNITFDPSNPADLAMVRALIDGAPAPSLQPAATPPAADPVPRAVMPQILPLHSTPGTLRFQAGGMTYMVSPATNGDAAWISLYSGPGTPADGVAQMSTVEATIDNSLDMHPPRNTDDAAKLYVAGLIPAIDAAIKKIGDRMSDLKTFPVYQGDIPASVSAYDRLAGRLVQMVKITSTGAVLV